MNDYEKINSRVPSEEYKENYDKIFGKKKEQEDKCVNYEDCSCEKEECKPS